MLEEGGSLRRRSPESLARKSGDRQEAGTGRRRCRWDTSL